MGMESHDPSCCKKILILISQGHAKLIAKNPPYVGLTINLELLYTHSMESRNNTADFPVLLRLVGVIWLVGASLEATVGDDNLSLVTFLLVIGCLIGIWLGWAQFRKNERFLSILGLSLVFIPWFISYSITDTPNLWLRLFILIQNAGIAFHQLLSGVAIDDAVLFRLVLGTIFWIFGLAAGLNFIRRKNPWLAVFTGGVIVLLLNILVVVTDKQRLAGAAFLVVVMLLLARSEFLQVQSEWQKKKAGIDTENGFDLNPMILISSLVIVVMGWNLPFLVSALTPGTQEQEIFNDYMDTLNQRFRNVIAPLTGAGDESIGSGGSLSFGTQISTDDAIVFRVDTSIVPPDGFHYYWRGRVYDTFQNNHWSDSQFSTQPLDSFNNTEEQILYDDSERVEYRVVAQSSLSEFYTLGTPYFINSDASIAYWFITEENKDIAQILPARVIDRGENYQAVGWLVNPTIEEMRAAGTEYPDWVMERYVQLPSGFSQQVTDLALEITSEADTPYDQVVAVTDYLRSNITYASVIPPAPANQDIIEWFLFQEQQGFCTYYASAEVLMLRSLGIPARLAIGYAEGVVTPDQLVYHVRQMDSHAWPEVFFPNIGWVIFEPTASLPQPVFSEGPEASVTQASAEELAQAYRERVSQSVQGPAFAEMESGVSQEFVVLLPEEPRTSPLVWYLLGIFSVAFGGVTFWYTRVRKTEPDLKYFVFIKRVIFGRQARLPFWLQKMITYLRMAPTEKAYTRLGWMVRWLGGDLPQTQTPSERLDWLVRQLPETAVDAAVVLEQVQRSRFSLDMPDDDAARKSSWKVFWLALRTGIKNKFTGKKTKTG